MGKGKEMTVFYIGVGIMVALFVMMALAPAAKKWLDRWEDV